MGEMLPYKMNYIVETITIKNRHISKRKLFQSKNIEFSYLPFESDPSSEIDITAFFSRIKLL